MKLTVDQGMLLKVLSHVQSVVERRNTIPILSNLRIKADNGMLCLTATDLDLEASDSTEAKIEQDGAATASAHTLFELVKKLPSGSEIMLESKDSRLNIEAGRSQFELPTLPVEDFQAMVSEDPQVSFQLEVDQLRRLIDKTRFAVSTEETRYYLNGIYLHIRKAEGGPFLCAVATDGHRLALADLKAPKGSAKLEGVIVPRKTVQEVRRLLDSETGSVQVQVSDSKIVFHIGQAVLISKLIEGAFPDYDRVIPKENSRLIRLDNKAFATAVSRVVTVSSERSQSVRLRAENNSLSIAVTSAETGRGEEDLAAEYTADPLDIGFNGRYLLDITDHVEGETLQLECEDGASPARLTDSGDELVQFVLMPLRV